MTQITLDGFNLFVAIGSHRDIFAEAETAVDKAATAILLKQLKSKGMSLHQAQQLSKAIGSDSFSLALDHVADGDLPKLIKKLDPHYGTLATAGANDLRRHAAALAANKTKPSPAAEKPTNAPRVTKAKKDASWPTSMSAKPKRRAS